MGTVRKKLTICIYFVSLLLFLLATNGCKKEESSWAWCSDCNSSTLIGAYEGTANHFRYIDTTRFVETPNQEAYLNISQSGSTMQIQGGVINLYSLSVSGVYQNTYYIEMGSSSQQFSATIWRNDDGSIKLVGTSKKKDGNGNTVQLLDFEVYKNN